MVLGVAKGNREPARMTLDCMPNPEVDTPVVSGDRNKGVDAELLDTFSRDAPYEVVEAAWRVAETSTALECDGEA